MPEMRKPSRQLPVSDALDILRRSEYGVLATADEDGQPYSLPLNYVYRQDQIYFHCASAGHKLDNMLSNNKVSFSVVEHAKVLPDKFSTAYKSAVVFGEAFEVKGIEKEKALEALLHKYSPQHLQEGIHHLKQFIHRTGVWKIKITRITGKANRC